MDLDAVALVVVLAAQVAGVDRRRRLLDGAHVVDRVAAAGDEVRIVELDRAAGRIRRALEAPPRILDQRSDRLAGMLLRADAHDLDARDETALVARVVALAAADALQPLRGERGHRVLRAAGLLLERADGADAEVRRGRQLHLAAHRLGPVRCVEQIEPEQDAIAAGAVDLAPLERVPDGVAVAAVGVHRDQTAGHEERRLALDVELLEHLQRRRRAIEGHRFGTGDGGGPTMRARQASSRAPVASVICRRANSL